MPRGIAGRQTRPQQARGFTRRAHKPGSVSYLVQLDPEQAYQQAVANRVQAQGNRNADTAALLEAFGGGWWNRENAPGAATR